MDAFEKRFNITSTNDDYRDEERKVLAERLLRFLGTNTIDILDGKKAEEILQSKESIKDFLLALDTNTYHKLLIGINGIIRNKDTGSAWEMDGREVRMGNLDIFPEQADKEELLGLSLEGAKEMLRNGRSIEDVAVLLALSITAIHPFENGNGRTAKFVLATLVKGYNKEILKEILSMDISNIVNSAIFHDFAATIVFKEKFPTWDGEGSSLGDFITDEEYDVLTRSREFTKRKVELIIDMIVNEDDPKYLIKANDPTIPSVKSFDFYKGQTLEGINQDFRAKFFSDPSYFKNLY